MRLVSISTNTSKVVVNIRSYSLFRGRIDRYQPHILMIYNFRFGWLNCATVTNFNLYKRGKSLVLTVMRRILETCMGSYFQILKIFVQLYKLIVNTHTYVHMKNHESVYLPICSDGTSCVGNALIKIDK